MTLGFREWKYTTNAKNYPFKDGWLLWPCHHHSFVHDSLTTHNGEHMSINSEISASDLVENLEEISLHCYTRSSVNVIYSNLQSLYSVLPVSKYLINLFITPPILWNILGKNNKNYKEKNTASDKKRYRHYSSQSFMTVIL